MQVQFIDIMIGKQVYITFHFRFVDPRAGHVEHHSAVGETRRVFDLRAGDLRSRGDAFPGIDLGWQEPEQLLHAVEDSAVGRAADADVFGRDVEAVRLGIAAVRRVERQHDGSVSRHAVADLAAEVFGGIAGQRLQSAVGGDGRSGAEREVSGAGRSLFRCGLRRSEKESPEKCREEQRKS